MSSPFLYVLQESTDYLTPNLWMQNLWRLLPHYPPPNQKHSLPRIHGPCEMVGISQVQYIGSFAHLKSNFPHLLVELRDHVL